MVRRHGALEGQAEESRRAPGPAKEIEEVTGASFGYAIVNVDLKRFEAALERAGKTWKRYSTALCALLLAFIIDWLSGFRFLKEQQQIEVAGFKVVREALSATYGILFSVFIATVFLESCQLLVRSATTDGALSDPPDALDLWLLSPFSGSRALRSIFWALFLYGFCLLAFFSIVHLMGHWPPNPGRNMSMGLYRGIGLFDLLLLIPCSYYGYRTYQNLQRVRSRLAPLS
jgi:hypothetical protein